MPNSRPMELNQSLGVGLGHNEFLKTNAPQMTPTYSQGKKHPPKAFRGVGTVSDRPFSNSKLSGWELLR